MSEESGGAPLRRVQREIWALFMELHRNAIDLDELF